MSAATFNLETSQVRLAMWRWGEPDGRPAVLMSHGTGFCAAVWQSVAEALAEEFVVYAFDRRGHGSSSKPVDAYQFADFAADSVAVIDALQLTAAYAIGHSAGATDLLLAAVQRPQAFRCILAMEPTMVVTPAPNACASEHAERLETATRKRASFASYADAFEHYRPRGVFRDWQPELLQAYVRHGFEARADGSVAPRCTREIELAALRPIVQAMDGTYRGHEFETLAQLRCPTLITTTERSQPIFKHMADAARQRIAGAAAQHFSGTGHCVAQVEPSAVIETAQRFWAASR